MSANTTQGQLGDVQESIKKLHAASYEKYPVNSAFPVGCEERAEFINRGMVDIKKRFPKAFK